MLKRTLAPGIKIDRINIKKSIDFCSNKKYDYYVNSYDLMKSISKGSALFIDDLKFYKPIKNEDVKKIEEFCRTNQAYLNYVNNIYESSQELMKTKINKDYNEAKI